MGNSRDSYLRLVRQNISARRLEDNEDPIRTNYSNLVEKENDLVAVNLKLSETIIKLDQSNVNLAKRTAELEESNEELKAAVKQRADFLAALSHDLKNPVIASTRILEMLFTGRLKCEKGSPVLNQLIESNRNILRMTWNLLDLYRNELGAAEPVIEETDLEALIQASFNEFSFIVAQKNLELKQTLDGAKVVLTDKVLLRRVLINLLDNAIRFSPNGSAILCDASMRNGALQISIGDTGPGMSEAEMQVLFEPFSQGKLGRDYSSGTGLGLYASRQIVELLGGTLICRSAPGAGTVFALNLPIERTKESA